MITLRIRFSSFTVRPKDWTLSCSYSHLSIFNFKFIMDIIYYSLWLIQHNFNTLNDTAFNVSLNDPSFEVSVQQKQLAFRYNCEVGSMRMALVDSYICLPCLCYPIRGTVWNGLADVAMFEKVCHCWWAFRLQKYKPGPLSVSISISHLCFSVSPSPHFSLSISLSLPMTWRWDNSFQLLSQHYACLPAAILTAMMIMKQLFDIIRKPPIKCFLLQVAFIMVFHYSRTVTKTLHKDSWIRCIDLQQNVEQIQSVKKIVSAWKYRTGIFKWRVVC